MTPALQAFLESDPGAVPLVRLFHVNFGSTQYFLNEGNTAMTVAGQVWQPSYGWISVDALELSGNPFDASPVYYTLWNIGNTDGAVLAKQALNNPEQWSKKRIRHLWTVRGFPDDAIVLHDGYIMDARPHESEGEAYIRIRAENIFAARNYTPLGEYTPRDQARRYPAITDKGLDYVATMPGKTIKGWMVG